MRVSLAIAVIVPLGCAGAERFDPGQVERHVPFVGVPAGFLLGAATSAHQIEGGNQNDWTDWEAGSYPDGRPHVRARASARVAADSWNRYPSDVEALELLGANVYRFGIEWSRLEPTEGSWNVEAAARYREMLQALRRASPQPITPMVNLYHFTLPRWVSARGGWEWPGAVAAFAAFAGRAGEAFGDLVDLWCTLNEPNVYATKGFLSGEWPPGVQDPPRAARVLATLIRAHGAATSALRARDRVVADRTGGAPTRIGLAHNVRVFEPASRANPLDWLVVHFADRFYNRALTDAIATGRIRVWLPTAISIDEPDPELRGSLDWLGLNYYTRDLVRARVSGMFGGGGSPYEVVPPRGEDLDGPLGGVSDLGWPIHPEGLLHELRVFSAYGWPLIVTENGLADAGGARRPGFIRSHVFAVDEARRGGVNVIGYLHWSLIDNFEWSHGYAGRFGLFSIDFEHDPTLRRTPTPAVATFRELARQLGLHPAADPRWP
jgi:beta-glucosidase